VTPGRASWSPAFRGSDFDGSWKMSVGVGHAALGLTSASTRFPTTRRAYSMSYSLCRLSQDWASVLKWRAGRKAVFAVIARLPLRISDKRLVGTLMSFAKR